MSMELGEEFSLSAAKIEAWQQRREVDIATYTITITFIPHLPYHSLRQRKTTRIPMERYVIPTLKGKKTTNFQGKF